MATSSARDRGRVNAPVTRPTRWWLEKLRARAATMYEEPLDFSRPVEFASEQERRACVAFFNAAFRAEESGFGQAHRLAEQVRTWDEELAECLVLYGNEEAWHRELLEQFFPAIGGEVRPMGRVTRRFYDSYANATEMESIVLTNLMFETYGATTYRLALGRVKHPTVRAMLQTLTRDESFHVPLNVHFLREILRHKQPSAWHELRLKGIYHGVFLALLGSAAASREVAQHFDQLSFRELAGAYMDNMGRLFVRESDLRFEPSALLLRAFGLRREALLEGDGVIGTSIQAAEKNADRKNVTV